jgi:integrase
MGKRRSFGSVRRVNGGRWQARYIDPLTGKRVQAPTTFATKGDAGRWLARVQAGTVDTQLAAAQRDGERLSSYAERWLEHRDLRPRTRELYAGQLRLHILPTLGDARVARLEPRNIRAWHADLARSDLSPVTVAKVYRLLRSILSTAVEDKLLVSNPCQIRSGGVERTPERPIPTLDQYRAVVAELPEHLAAVAALAAFAGLRKGEILGLQRKHIDLGAGTVRIDGALQEVNGRGAVRVEPKTASSRRVVAAPAHLVEVLAAHLAVHVDEAPDAYLFTNGNGDPVRRSVWHPAWDQARSAVGLDELRLHDLRHLAGTLTAQAGATLKETMAWLGHTSVAAALRYQHVADNRSAEIAARMDDLIRPDHDR